ncbi:MAG TPA: GNAT family protein [Usitatibacter sp.]|nr:GNAT family protein [Usitatibacter sp.]
MSGDASGAPPRTNALGQPIGPALPAWTPRAAPPRTPMAGRHCRLEPLDGPRHAAALHEANSLDREGRSMTYLFTDPFATPEAYRAWVDEVSRKDDPLFHAIVDSAGRAAGVAAFMRIDGANGVIEIGHLNFSPLLQRTTAATEAIYLMLRRAFDELGYRRVEWKCDSLNAPSRAAALRFGFAFEGIFRQAVVYKGRSRDTAWYAIVDGEWPGIRSAFERWLSPGNFDGEGRQRGKLAAFMAAGAGTSREDG